MASHGETRIAHRFLLAAAIVALAFPTRSAAQEPLPAALLRRLGSAVEGYRTGRPVWVVASLQFPHDVRGVFPSAPEAMRVATISGTAYRAFGPYVGTPDTTADGSTTEAFSILCVKDKDTNCAPDSTKNYSTVQDVSSVIITLVGRAGVVSDTLRADQVEAVFFRMSAIDKLLIPYYTQLYGSRYAARLREEYLARTAAQHR